MDYHADAETNYVVRYDYFHDWWFAVVDIPNLIVNRGGTNGVASTVVMDISTRINSSQGDMGVAGAESVVLFLAAGLIGIFMFRIMQSDEDKEIKARKKAERKARKQAKGVQ